MRSALVEATAAFGTGRAPQPWGEQSLKNRSTNPVLEFSLLLVQGFNEKYGAGNHDVTILPPLMECTDSRRNEIALPCIPAPDNDLHGVSDEDKLSDEDDRHDGHCSVPLHTTAAIEPNLSRVPRAYGVHPVKVKPLI